MSRVAERVRTDPRISRRRQAVERTRRRRMLTRVIIVASLLLGAWGIFFSPLLGVRNVHVTGTRHVSDADIMDVTGLGPRDNLLLLSTGRVAQKVETLPWVKSAAVDRKLPGTVRVRVVERRPAMVLSLGPASWTVDAAANVLTAGRTSKQLPVLGGLTLRHVVVGERLGSEAARSALAVYRSLEPQTRSRVAGVFAPTIERTTLSLRNGIAVRFGAPEELRAKSRVLAALMKQLKATGSTPSYIDVRVPSNPAVANAPAAPAGDGTPPGSSPAT